jgi:FkbM family methyltransferase
MRRTEMRSGVQGFIGRTLGIERVSRKRVVDRFDAVRTVLGSDPDVIFDIGANRGQTTSRYRAEFPRARIYSFEPHPDLFNQLQENVGRVDGVEVHQLAMGERPGKVTLHLNRFDMNHSLLNQADDAQRWARVDHQDDIEVEASTVDVFCEEAGIDRVDLLKIDTEGADLLVLRGAETMLARQQVGSAYVELLNVPIFSGQPYYFDIARFLFDRGYVMFDRYQIRYDKRGRVISSNGLFFPAT